MRLVQLIGLPGLALTIQWRSQNDIIYILLSRWRVVSAVNIAEIACYFLLLYSIFIAIKINRLPTFPWVNISQIEIEYEGALFLQ